MRVIRKRCLICLGWFSPFAHAEHCPFCGAYQVGSKHYSLNFAASKLIELVSVCHVPLALRNNYYNK
jgi:hypothetical protein